MDSTLQLQVNDRYFDGQSLTVQRQRLEAIHGKGNVSTTEELEERFEIVSCCAPYCAVRDRLTGKKGIVELRKHVPWLLD